MLSEAGHMPEAEHDAFGHLCASLFLVRGDLVVMLTAYFDESYNQRTEKNVTDPLIYTVACWLSTVAQWKRFGKQWKSALRSAGVPDDHFHMNNYENRIGFYEDWSQLKRVGVLKRLHRIIKDNVIYGCSYSVDRSAFDEVVTSDVKKFFGRTCYGFCSYACMSELNAWCDENKYEDSIHYVFAQLAKQGGALDALFIDALKNPRLKSALRLTGMWTKGFPKDVAQLQSADVVAYEANKRIVNVFSSGEKFIRKSLENLQLGKRFHGGYFGKTELNENGVGLPAR